MSIALALRDLLESTQAVTVLAGTYTEGSYSSPAIFEGEAAPVGYDVENDGPCIVIGGATGTQNQDTFCAYMAREVYRLRVYAPKGQEHAQKLAEAVKKTLHDKPLTASGLDVHGMTAERPVIGPTSSSGASATTTKPSLEGRIVTLTVHIKEK